MGVLEEWPRPWGHLEDKILWPIGLEDPWPWPRPCCPRTHRD